VVVVRVTTTTTEPATKPAKKSKESRLEELRRAISVREQERDCLVAKIDDTKQREEKSVKVSLESSPRSRAYREGERATMLQIDLARFENDLENLSSEIEALQPMVREQVDREREAQVGEIRGALFKLGEAEEIVWQQAGEVVDELLDLWDGYREVLEQRSGIFQDAIRAGIIQKSDADTYRELEDLTRGPITPANGTIATFLARILDVTVDHDGLDCRDPQGRPADQRRRLPELLPDKRDRLRRLELAGGIFELR